MLHIFEIYLYICGAIIGGAILVGLLGLTLNLICYAYQSSVGFNTFRKFLRKYHNEMKKEKVYKVDASNAFEKQEKKQ